MCNALQYLDADWRVKREKLEEEAEEVVAVYARHVNITRPSLLEVDQ